MEFHNRSSTFGLKDGRTGTTIIGMMAVGSTNSLSGATQVPPQEVALDMWFPYAKGYLES